MFKIKWGEAEFVVYSVQNKDSVFDTRFLIYDDVYEDGKWMWIRCIFCEPVKDKKKGEEIMYNEFEFYIPEGQIIPTKLRLKKDKVLIYYEKLNDKFGYKFELYKLDSKEQGDEIIREIADIMCNQSYNHQQEWRIVNIECVKFNYYDLCKNGEWQVEFRIKDSY